MLQHVENFYDLSFLMFGELLEYTDGKLSVRKQRLLEEEETVWQIRNISIFSSKE
jgi:hypothetical protein